MVQLTPAKAQETSFVPAEAMVSCRAAAVARQTRQPQSASRSHSFRRSHLRNESYSAPVGVTAVDSAAITYLELGVIGQGRNQIEIIVVVQN